MAARDGEAGDGARRVLAIREEMKFEIGVLHDRVNALVSAEAFLFIAFTMALAYGGERGPGRAWVAPLLALVGFLLAVLAWPGVGRSATIVTEWNALLIEAMARARADPGFVWRPSVDAAGPARTQAHHRRGMLFSRLVPAVFALAWPLLAALALAGALPRP